jgi:hypothetical protein
MARPKKDIPLKQVEALGMLQCTIDEVSLVLGIPPSTLKSRPDVMETFNKGREKGKMSLRRAQWKKAMEGNVTMLIWLGKQYLNQREPQLNIGLGEIEHIPDFEQMSNEELMKFLKENQSLLKGISLDEKE